MGQDTKIAATDNAAEDKAASTAKPHAPARGAAKVPGKGRDVSSTLRSVYQNTVDEPVPDDLLDLLGKLG